MIRESARLRVAVLTSGSAPGIETLLRDPARGAIYEICAAISPESAIPNAAEIEAARIPVILLPPPAASGLSRHSLPARRHFDAELVEVLRRLDVDYLFLSDYRYRVTGTLIEAYENRIVAMHDGDLSLMDGDGERKYRGFHAVTDALMAGERETRSSAFFVTSHSCDGPLMLLGHRYEVPQIARAARDRGDADILTRYADLHREWMRRDSWGPMMLRAIELLAAGTVKIVKDLVWIDGAPAPCLMGEAPAVCCEEGAPIAAGIPRSCPFIRA